MYGPGNKAGAEVLRALISAFPQDNGGSCFVFFFPSCLLAQSLLYL